MSSTPFRADKTVLFLPDRNLGAYVQKQTGRVNMKIWQGACIVHATFPERRLLDAMREHPEAVVIAHPECPEPVLEARRIYRIHLRPHRLLCPQPRARIHSHDGKWRQIFHAEVRARQALLLRRE